MQLNAKYLLPRETARVTLGRLSNQISKATPTKDINTIIVLEELWEKSEEYFAVQRIYKGDQIKEGRLTGKPYRIQMNKLGEPGTDFVYSSHLELRKMLELIGFQAICEMTQMKTSFPLSDPLVTIPITINEIRELGSFIEVGNAVGPSTSLNRLLSVLTSNGIDPKSIEPQSYYEMLLNKGSP